MHHPRTYRAERSNTGHSSPHAGSVAFSSTAGSVPKSALSKSYTGDEYRAGAYSAPRHPLPGITSRSMTSPSMASASIAESSPAITVPASAKTMPNLMHARLHKRGGSGSGSTLAGNLPPIVSTSFTNNEPFPDIVTPIQSSPVARVKPYLRKLSSTKDDQGRIDLSKSLADNDKLAGLGIQDFGPRPANDAVFAPTSRRASHGRTTSVGSQMSNSSGSHRPQPFIHPMRQAPRPYTPTARSQTSSPQEGDDDDFVDEDLRSPPTFRARRSMSNSSGAHIAPTPLSQTITAADLGAIPRLASVSQSNLSIISTKSSKPAASRRNTGRSQDLATSPSSRMSFERGLSLGPRRSDTEAQTRDERIQAARRKFQEKEADKDRKAEKDALKKRETEVARELRKQERQRRKSDASDRARIQRPGTSNGRGSGRSGSALGMVSSLAYDSTPTPTPLSTQSEKVPHVTQSQRIPQKTGLFSRLFSCGGRRK